MRMYDIIMKKREGQVLSKEEIDYFIKGYSNGKIKDYQVSALMMAIYFQKMNKRETKDLTQAIVESGEVLDLSKIQGVKVDKHSTGGVGDTTTLIVGPLVAALGVPVAKMSGRGLGHTGGTIDKLESFKNFRVDMTMDEFVENVNQRKIAIGAQTQDLAYADKKLYALRDVTATVDNLSLVASSIMSKKIASGADAIVLDVKVGKGAFMKNEEDAFQLAQQMVDIGISMGRETMAVVTDMNQPLGYAIGNALEVKEAICTLKGEGPKDLEELCLTLGSFMLLVGKKVTDIHTGREKLLQAMKDLKGIDKLKEMIKGQGADPKWVDDPSYLPKAKINKSIISKRSGYVKTLDALMIGKASLVVGAGRETKESKIDLGVGIKLRKKIGDYINKEEVLGYVYGNDVQKVQEALKIVESAYEIVEDKVQPPRLIKGVVTQKGIEKFKR